MERSPLTRHARICDRPVMRQDDLLRHKKSQADTVRFGRAEKVERIKILQDADTGVDNVDTNRLVARISLDLQSAAVRHSFDGIVEHVEQRFPKLVFIAIKQWQVRRALDRHLDLLPEFAFFDYCDHLVYQ